MSDDLARHYGQSHNARFIDPRYATPHVPAPVPSEVEAVKLNQDARVVLAMHLDDIAEGKSVDMDEVYAWWTSLVDSCADIISENATLTAKCERLRAERDWLAKTSLTFLNGTPVPDTPYVRSDGAARLVIKLAQRELRATLAGDTDA